MEGSTKNVRFSTENWPYLGNGERYSQGYCQSLKPKIFGAFGCRPSLEKTCVSKNFIGSLELSVQLFLYVFTILLRNTVCI